MAVLRADLAAVRRSRRAISGAICSLTMNQIPRLLPVAIVTGMLLTNAAFATNPLVTDQFTADPTARVFDGKIYV